MIKQIHFPWASGLGTLGFRFDNKYVDYSVSVDKRIKKFVALYEDGKYEKSCFTSRSWYVLTRKGWRLVKRDDFFGTFQNGRRRPSLREFPAIGTVSRAWELRKFFKPYQLIDWYGEQLEVISFPCPEKNSVTLMLRVKNDPTTLREVVLEEYYVEDTAVSL